MPDLLHSLTKSRVSLEFCQIGFKFVAGHFSSFCTISYPRFEPGILVKWNDPVAIFLNVLKTLKPTPSTFRSFQSTNHVLRTVEINKTCLNAFDDKRYILQDGVGTLSYGHFRALWTLYILYSNIILYSLILLCLLYLNIVVIFEHWRGILCVNTDRAWQ